ncbi:MAG: hypothetical protein K2N72_02065 [Oscillospiraceae bacterium]|nr:hypothetical protein [Oscillospiraceae bacterium]
MKFEDVFPYDKEEFPFKEDYSFVVKFFNEYTEYKNFPEFFEGQAEGIGCGFHEFAGINLPNGEDQNMMCGPRIWEGPSFCMNDQELDFHQFAVIMLTAARVFLENMREKGITEYRRYINLVDNTEHVYTEKRFLGDIEKFRENFLNVERIKEICYGEDYYVTDDEGVITGEHHGKEWGEEWYEKYGKYLNFDDVDKSIEANFAAYYKRKKGVKKC